MKKILFLALFLSALPLAATSLLAGDLKVVEGTYREIFQKDKIRTEEGYLYTISPDHSQEVLVILKHIVSKGDRIRITLQDGKVVGVKLLPKPSPETGPPQALPEKTDARKLKELFLSLRPGDSILINKTEGRVYSIGPSEVVIQNRVGNEYLGISTIRLDQVDELKILKRASDTPVGPTEGPKPPPLEKGEYDPGRVKVGDPVIINNVAGIILAVAEDAISLRKMGGGKYTVKHAEVRSFKPTTFEELGLLKKKGEDHEGHRIYTGKVEYTPQQELDWKTNKWILQAEVIHKLEDMILDKIRFSITVSGEGIIYGPEKEKEVLRNIKLLGSDRYPFGMDGKTFLDTRGGDIILGDLGNYTETTTIELPPLLPIHPPYSNPVWSSPIDFGHQRELPLLLISE